MGLTSIFLCCLKNSVHSQPIFFVFILFYFSTVILASPFKVNVDKVNQVLAIVVVNKERYDGNEF